MAMPNRHQLDLSDPTLREQFGLRQESIDTVSKRSQWWKQMKQDYRDREDTKQAILEVLRAAPEPLSRRDIVRVLGRAKSPYLLDVLAEMCCCGLILQHESAWRNGLLMFVYEVAS